MALHTIQGLYLRSSTKIHRKPIYPYSTSQGWCSNKAMHWY